MRPELAALRDAEAIDMRPMSLALKHALIAMDIEHELLSGSLPEASSPLPSGFNAPPVASREIRTGAFSPSPVSEAAPSLQVIALPVASGVTREPLQLEAPCR